MSRLRPFLLFDRLLFSDHVRLQWREVPAGVEGAQLGHGGSVLLHPALFGYGQPDGTAEQVGLNLAKGQNVANVFEEHVPIPN